MKLWINGKCPCEIRWTGISNMTKKRFIEDNFFLRCEKCGCRMEILFIKNDREKKIESILKKISKD